MDIITVVVVLVLIAIFFGSVVWMEIYSRKTSSKLYRRDTKSPETEMAGQFSAFTTLRPYQDAKSNTRRVKERES